ncbi:hypothetical protein FNW52_19540 [Flavobacterium sp. ZT3R18]|uniref:hypothetical protein n=1 Tax=Flavobacterium sp. ZT3R18 TaxID=2594429 RepID=UPI00117B6427|nr:hypothetical protein [Flavobacterium sp. ZT3R18]TRX30908.1 hypothetical protein FNW52_19540 [Flavobacterium sp. ZT3R18]
MKVFIKIIQRIFAILLLSFFLYFITSVIVGHIVRDDIEFNGRISVGKYILHRHWAKGQTNYLSFNINNVRYKGINSGKEPPQRFSKNIGKFYKIRYSEKFKGSMEAFFDEQVTDSTEILKAGFTMKDILSNENDTINIREGSFKEEVLTILGIN